MADISETLAARSDQLNASDLSGGPITVTVESVDVLKGSEQPVHIHLVGMKGRPYKPSLGMRRVIAQGWGPNSDTYAGKSMTLYRNPEVTWAGEKIGGIEVSHMSHLEGPLTTSVRINRKSAKPHVVQPLTVTPPRDWSAEIAAADMDGLRALWSVAPDEHKPAITEKVNALKESGADA